MLADIELLEALVAGTLLKQRAVIAVLYLEARKLASPREFASVLDQIGFVAEMGRRARPELAAELEALAQAVRPPAVGKAEGPSENVHAAGKPPKVARARRKPAAKAARKQKPARRRKGRPGSASH
jgi:hypothetical protein